MIKGMVRWSVVIAFLLSVSGCMVTKGTYLKKVDENETLKKQIAAANILNENQKKEINRQTGEISELNNILIAKQDDLSKKIAEQRSQNALLKKEIGDLQKSKEEKIQEVSKTYGEMLEKMKSEVAKGQVTITELKGKLTVNMVEAILFDSGKAEVKSDGLKVLGKVTDVLKNVKDKSIRIEGHTDNIRIKGALAQKYPTNWELSSARAINVARYLQEQGVDPTLLSAAAFGEYKPIASNGTSEGRAKNRRIEIILIPKE
jgi:chemotaxis protein MotB